VSLVKPVEQSLAAFYDRELHHRADRHLSASRIELRASFMTMLRTEGRTSVVEVGAGAGQDGVAFREQGFSYQGTDLSAASPSICSCLGLDVRQGSALALPFADHQFAAGWSMSTLMHITDDDIDTALAEIRRVLETGALLALGTWGCRTDGEQGATTLTNTFGQRAFTLRTDDEWRTRLAAIGTVESLTILKLDPWPYQEAIVRIG